MRKLFTWLLITILLIGNIPVISVSATAVVQSGTYEEDLVSSQLTATPTQTQKPNESNYDLSDPRTGTDGSVTWDCVWFGNYWQEDTNGDDKADKNDAKQPVKWRVLSVDGNDAFLLADKNLDYQRYNNTYATKITWETCTMRSWLNGYGADSNVCGKDYTDDNFLKNAFTALEQPAIETINVENNPTYGAVGGNDTQDKIYLLSIEEVCNPAYGFTSTTDKTLTRVNRNTTYTAAIGKYIENNENANGWWLRSLASIDGQEFGTGSDGGVGTSGHAVGYRYGAVRPALHLNLSSLSAWSPAGTVTSEGGGSEIAPPGQGASVTPTSTPAHSHVYVDWQSNVTTHWKECSCGDKKDETAHTEDTGTVTKEPTETETGIRTYKCSVCGYITRTEEIAMLPSSHTHAYGTDWKSSTATHWKECSCGEKKDETAHTEDAGTITKEPTETEAGVRTYKCSVCGYVTRTEKIAMLPPSHTHSYGTDWKSSAATHWKECSCGDKKDETAHTEDAGTVTKEPTETETGVRTYKCSVCGYVTRTEEIKKLEDEKKPNKKPDTEKPNDKLPSISKDERKKNNIQMNKKISFGWTGNSLTVTWNKLKNASGYDIYAAVCGKDFDEVTLSVKGNNKTSEKIKIVDGKNISKTITYKVKIYAYRLVDGKKQYIGTSNAMHVAGSKNRQITNAKKIRLAKTSYVIRKGYTKIIKANIVKCDKKKKLLSEKHGPKLMYTSSDENIATVTKSGKIKAKKKGSCTIYVHALNGISKTFKVTVK